MERIASLSRSWSRFLAGDVGSRTLTLYFISINGGMSVNKRFASGAVYTSARLLSEVANTTTLLPPRLITYLLPGAMSRVSLVSFCFFYSHPTLSMVSVFCIFAGWIYLPGIIYIYILSREESLIQIQDTTHSLAFTGVVCYLAIIVWELAIKCHFIHILVVRSRRQTHSYYCSGKNTKSSASKQQVSVEKVLPAELQRR